MSQGDDVKTEVLSAPHWDLAVPRHRAKVEVENGWVTMSGMVDRPDRGLPRCSDEILRDLGLSKEKIVAYHRRFPTPTPTRCGYRPPVADTPFALFDAMAPGDAPSPQTGKAPSSSGRHLTLV